MGGEKKGWKGEEEEVIERQQVGKRLSYSDFETWERRGRLKGKIVPSYQGG